MVLPFTFRNSHRHHGEWQYHCGLYFLERIRLRAFIHGNANLVFKFDVRHTGGNHSEWEGLHCRLYFFCCLWIHDLIHRDANLVFKFPFRHCAWRVSEWELDCDLHHILCVWLWTVEYRYTYLEWEFAVRHTGGNRAQVSRLIGIG